MEFAGSVTHEELIAYYAAADAFVCLSNHEGFCVPLLEAMYHRLPIVAYTNTAVPETVQGAGLILPNKEPVRVAAAIDRVVGDPELRAMLAEAASERVADLRPAPGAGTGSPPPSRPPARRDAGDQAPASPMPDEGRLRAYPGTGRPSSAAPRPRPGRWPNAWWPARAGR